MKLLKVLAVAMAVSASGIAMADSQVVKPGYVFDGKALIPSGARLEIGSIGYGGALLWDVNPYVGLALGYNGGDISWTDDLSISGTKYDLDMDNNNVYLNAEIRPWGANSNRWVQGIYVAAGAAYLDNDYDLKKRIGNGSTLSIDGNSYQLAVAGQEGGVVGKMKNQRDIAPYVGFGWAPKINQNWGVFGEVGAYYTGNPAVDLQSYNLVPVTGNNVSAELAVEREESKIENKDRFEWLPVGKVGVSYRW